MLLGQCAKRFGLGRGQGPNFRCFFFNFDGNQASPNGLAKLTFISVVESASVTVNLAAASLRNAIVGQTMSLPY